MNSKPGRSLVGLCLAGGLALLLGTAAQALPVDLIIGGQITEDGTGVAGVGTMIDISLLVDTAVANEEVTPGLFHSTVIGPVSSFLVVAVGGNYADISSDVVAQTWDASGTLDALGVIFMPFTIDLQGSGMTANQVLPDFSVLNSGEIVVNVASLQSLLTGMTSNFVRADVTSITMAPEPTTALLLGLGILALTGAVRRVKRD